MIRPRLVHILLPALALILPLAAVAQNSFDWQIDDRGAVKDLLVLNEFHTEIHNTGDSRDTYTITLVRDMPTEWATSMCDENLCYPPFIFELEFTVDPGSFEFIGINITPADIPGSGKATVTVSSANEPANVVTAEFTVISGGVDILVVDADGGDDTETATMDALASQGGYTVEVWDLAAYGKLTDLELQTFPTVIWGAGANPQGLDDTDRAALATFLQNDGNLLLCGENLAYGVGDPGSPDFDAAAHTWLQTNLKAQYVSDNALDNMVVGVPADPVGMDRLFAVDTGPAPHLPDVVAAVSGGSVCLEYVGGETAGVRARNGDGHTVYLPFGVEHIVNNTERDALFAAILDWFASGPTAVFDLPGAVLANLQAAPNPFNPRTTISFSLAGERALPVQVTVYDVAGRKVRDLFAGAREPGDHRLAWDGRDDGGRSLAGGLYLARVRAGDQIEHLKMVLAK